MDSYSGFLNGHSETPNQGVVMSTRSSMRTKAHYTPNASASIDSMSSSGTGSFATMSEASHAYSQSEQRRHSTRSVKRRKFDDELVESSLGKQERNRTTSRSLTDISETVKPQVSTSESQLSQSNQSPTIVTRTTRAAAAAAASSSQSLPSTAPTSSEKISPKVEAVERKKISSKSSTKSKIKRSKAVVPPSINPTKDLGRWKPQDDLLLIEAVQQTSDLKAVHLGVKFSCNFTLRDIEDRWYALLYDEKLSKCATGAIQQLPTDLVISIQSKALFSKVEEDILCTIPLGSQPTIEKFAELLQENLGLFHRARTAKSLYQHWHLMKQYHLLPDQSVTPLPKGDHVLNFSDAEDLVDDSALTEPANEALQRELLLNDRKQKKEIRHLEQEIPRWQVLVESVAGISTPDFDNQTLAILRGRLVRYLMRSREITIGRSAKNNQVDVDLSLEGPAWKISRRQGMIKLRNSGEFIITNDGRRPIFVDGKPVLSNSKQKLDNNSVIEITRLRFIFLINQELLRTIKMDPHKPTS